MTAAHYKGGHHPGNDLGLHYTALPPILASCPYSDQLLVTRKFWSPGANRPSQVSIDLLRFTVPEGEEVQFAADSPVEREGFEPSVPLAKKPRFGPLARASKDGQSTCRGPGPPARREDV